MDIANELYFSPLVKFSEIKWEDKDALIEAFKDRVKGFYLDPAQELNKSEKYAFATGVLCVSTIDLLACITISCNSGTVGTRFKQWIKENISAFNNSNPNREILADKFYEDFRNGLVHEGRIKNVGQFSYDKKKKLVHILKEMFLFSWDEIPGNDTDKFGMNEDKRRFVHLNAQRFYEVYPVNTPTESPQGTQRSQSSDKTVIKFEMGTASRFRTQMTRIARIFTDSCASVFYCTPPRFNLCSSAVNINGG